MAALKEHMKSCTVTRTEMGQYKKKVDEQVRINWGCTDVVVCSPTLAKLESVSLVSYFCEHCIWVLWDDLVYEWMCVCELYVHK